MALAHAAPGDIVDVAPLGPRLGATPTRALFKSDDLELMHLVLPAGRALPPHRVPGELTIHCLEGRMEVTVGGEPRTLHAGQLLFLQGGASHAVRALEDTTALVTVALVG